MSDLDIAARIEAWKAAVTDGRCMGLQTQAGFGVYQVGGDDISRGVGLMRELLQERDALLAALEPIVWQLESAQRSTAPAFLKGFTMNDTESGALLRAIAAAKETDHG